MEFREKRKEMNEINSVDMNKLKFIFLPICGIAERKMVC